MHLNAAGPGQPPQKMPVAMVDLLAAHQLKEGLLVALYQRERTGRMAHWCKSVCWKAPSQPRPIRLLAYLVTGHDPQPLGSGHPSIVPYGTVYEAADGQRLVLAVGSDGQFRQLCARRWIRPKWAALMPASALIRRGWRTARHWRKLLGGTDCRSKRGRPAG